MENKKKKIIAILLALLLLGGLGYYYANQSEDIEPPEPPIPTPIPTPTPTPTLSGPGVTVTTPEITPTPTPRYGRGGRRGSGGGGGVIATPTPTPTLMPTPTPTPEPEGHDLLVCNEDYVCRPEGTTEPLLEGSNLMPGMDKECKVMSLKNNGTENKTAYMKFYNVNGDLAEYLVFAVVVTENGAGLKAEGNLTTLNNQEIELGNIAGGDFSRMRICWLLPSETPNEAQEKPVTFDMDFYFR